MKFLLEPIKNVPKIDELYCFAFRRSMFTISNICSENCPAKVQKIELGALQKCARLVDLDKC